MQIIISCRKKNGISFPILFNKEKSAPKLQQLPTSYECPVVNFLQDPVAFIFKKLS